ncbi:MAG: LutC/YkgG family protein [Propionibacteriaceae bacterium]
MSARDDVLARIRAAHRAAPPPVLAYTDIARNYQTSSELDHDQLLDRLVDRLLDYKALVRQTSTDQLAATVATALAERGVDTLVVPAGLDDGWLTGTTVTRHLDTATDPLSVTELDAVDGVITTCAVAVAETGTLILDASAGQGRRAVSLVPDYHLCVVRAGTVVADVPQALARLEATRPLTMISGPSATSDIELNRVEGVHGPRTLEVIIVN